MEFISGTFWNWESGMCLVTSLVGYGGKEDDIVKANQVIVCKASTH